MAEHEPPPATAGLQLDHAEFEHPAPAAITCAQCQRAIADQYHEAGGRTVCDRCRRLIEAELNAGSPIGRFVRAGALGAGAAVLGAILWYWFQRLTSWRLSLITIIMGFLVGGAVRRGSAARGGWLYQLLAALLTYFSVALSNTPLVLEQMAAKGGSAEAPTELGTVLFAFVIAAVAPLFGAFQDILGSVIIGFGMYQAWAMNKRVQMTFNGPFRVGVAPLPPSPPASA